MNITKAFCLSIALLGASNMQAITNSDFVIQQDNTQINNYQTNRKHRNVCLSRKLWNNRLRISSNC